MAQEEYIQAYGKEYNDIADEYYVLVEQFQYYRDDLSDTDLKGVQRVLNKMITMLPEYLDPYLLLSSIHHYLGQEDQADQLLENAYQKALELICDRQGNFPNKLEWGWLENRPIIRALHQKAEKLWEQGAQDTKTWQQAQTLHENILKMNPNDNTGIRYSLLAMLEKMSHQKYMDTWTRQHPEHGEIFAEGHEEWFRMKAPKHEELKWWMNEYFIE